MRMNIVQKMIRFLIQKKKISVEVNFKKDNEDEDDDSFINDNGRI